MGLSVYREWRDFFKPRTAQQFTRTQHFTQRCWLLYWIPAQPQLPALVIYACHTFIPFDGSRQVDTWTFLTQNNVTAARLFKPMSMQHSAPMQIHRYKLPHGSSGDGDFRRARAAIASVAGGHRFVFSVSHFLSGRGGDFWKIIQI